LYFLSDKLYAIYPDGQLQWEFPYTGYSGGAPAIGADGTIYFGTSDLHVYAVNPDGSERWKYKDYQTYYSSATIGQDGTVFISNETKFRAFYSLCGGLANAPWPEYRYDGQNTAYGTVDSIPHLYIIDDHPNDQGGWLDVQFTHSNYDNDPETTAEYYIVQKNEGNQWKAIDTVLAAGEKLYSLIVSTAKDSNALSRNDVQLQVTAFLNEGIFESKIDSGYSVDNIAPFKPVGFSAALNDSATILSWQANTESDINFYSVYRVFGREQLELLDMTSDTFYVDKNIDYGETYSYTISATDSAGNESDFSSYVQIKVTSLNQVNNFPARNYLYQNYPNPFNPNTKINYELKHPANVEIIIFDLSGRIIKKIVKKDQPAGYHFLDFDGSHLASGIYFYQLKTKYYIKSRKMLLLK